MRLSVYLEYSLMLRWSRIEEFNVYWEYQNNETPEVLAKLKQGPVNSDSRIRSTENRVYVRKQKKNFNK